MGCFNNKFDRSCQETALIVNQRNQRADYNGIQYTASSYSLRSGLSNTSIYPHLLFILNNI